MEEAMTELITWLRAQLDDEERMARAPFVTARALAEVEAKRRILDLVPDIQEAEDTARQDYGRDAKAAIRLVQLLALPYADRPGYLEQWQP
jgi:hypothetical protein